MSTLGSMLHGLRPSACITTRAGAGSLLLLAFAAQAQVAPEWSLSTAGATAVTSALDRSNSVLAAGTNSTPAMLVTMNLQDNEMQIQRLNAVTEGREDSMQLWALSDGDPARSLGVLQSKGKTLRLPATERDFASATRLAISVEDKGGVTQAKGPRLPYLFTGSVVQKAL